MLKQRVLTAVVLLAILGATIRAPSVWPFLVFLAIACGCAGWEWVRLTMPGSKFLPLVAGLGLFSVSLIQADDWINQPHPNYNWFLIGTMLSVCVWLCAVVPAVLQGRADKPARSILWTIFAPISLYATWAALAYVYIQFGAMYVLSLLILIWVADIGAYFAGKAFGRHKLAPAISPGKTVEGAAAGLLCVVLWIIASSYWPASFGASLVSHWSLAGAVLCALLLGALSIIGDLFESLLKRRAGIKDSSHLLPGHGGVYDRIDAVVAVVPFAFLMTEFSSGLMPW
jgi:phosphatidate cytidylyltransferase